MGARCARTSKHKQMGTFGLTQSERASPFAPPLALINRLSDAHSNALAEYAYAYPPVPVELLQVSIYDFANKLVLFSLDSALEQLSANVFCWSLLTRRCL